MFSGWPRTVQVGGIFGFVVTCALLASLPSSQVSPQASFAAPPLFSVGGNEVGITGFYSMVKGDFNGDGIPDFAVVGFACSNGTGLPADSVAIYLGNGDGTFRSPAYYPAGACPFNVVAGRLRGANAPEDLVIADEGFGANGITVLLGNGDGTFQLSGSIPTPSTPTASAIGDFNGDGKGDLAVALFGGS
ncbi:MAG: large repetitive protein, partial [Verrucomicrobiota bacterium]